MTIEEEVQQLKSKLAAAQQTIQEVEETIDLWRVNGADQLLGGYGAAVFGGGLLRLSQNGIEVKAADEYFGMLFLQEFLTRAFDSSNDTYAGLVAVIDSLEIDFRLEAQNTTDNSETIVAVSAIAGLVSAAVEVIANDSTGLAKVNMNAPLKLYADDPPVFEDGMIWYDPVADQFKGRANGATVTFTVS